MNLLKLNYSVSVLAMLALLFVSVSCGGNQSTEGKGKEYTSTYVCPMHCEGSGSEEPGTCPVCGMDYVRNEEHMEDGHHHHHDGDDHGHQH
ncbi:MAG: heavy metal-binding domain-containing protein [Saprospiraceae bacterium]|nr:heavy metal-binding domain-containing protein [Saprospiraceae bacterium]